MSIGVVCFHSVGKEIFTLTFILSVSGTFGKALKLSLPTTQYKKLPLFHVINKIQTKSNQRTMPYRDASLACHKDRNQIYKSSATKFSKILLTTGPHDQRSEGRKMSTCSVIKGGKMREDGYEHTEFRTVVINPGSLSIIFKGS